MALLTHAEEALTDKIRQTHLGTFSLHVCPNLQVKDLGQEIRFAAEVGVHGTCRQPKAAGQVPYRDRGVPRIRKEVGGEVQQP